ncbi:hypothetical protein AMK59_8554 [Oryctes borbonicus]|uniref:CBF1-interacting co-repressor CIR N-terminal domain-containing protein n=1 Tax=Oryctes borbonicus TaxID=1629725 RepID=A0A0T6AUX5_9SCAR|nr:hypothetical protein AMK59_8554 [Oryctes borbonicus]
MNILPKKRWHVRNRDNIARVRKDEAKAAEEERLKQERAKLAEREARTQLLRDKAKERLKTSEFISFSSEDAPVNIQTEDGHINFFKDFEEGIDECKKANVEHDKEKKEEQEQYEKKIGYLTYLGQDTNEALGKQSWYNVAPDRLHKNNEEVNLKTKAKLDPLSIMKKYITKPDATVAKNKDVPKESNLRFPAENISKQKKHKEKGKYKTDSESDSSERRKKKRTKKCSNSDESNDESEAA